MSGSIPAKHTSPAAAPIFALLKIAAIVLLLFLMIDQLKGQKISKADFDTVEKAVMDTVDTSVIKEADPAMIRRLYGLESKDFDRIILYYPSSNMGAEEVLLVKLHDTDQAGLVRQAVDRRLSAQKASFAGYGADQTAMLEAAQIDVEGNYILFISSAQPDKTVAAFKKSL